MIGRILTVGTCGLIGLLASSLAAQEMHGWTSSAGTTIDAAFISIDRDAKSVTLWVEKTIAFEKLSEESILQARMLDKKSKTKSPAEKSGPIPFMIIGLDSAGKHKASLDVRVNLVDGRLPTEEQLAEVSNLLVKALPHERKFVGFYLPDMVIDSGYFATAHHNPTLEVKINTWALPQKYQELLK